MLATRLYHYLDVLSSKLAQRFARTVLRSDRRTVQTARGAFWVDPLSNFGRDLLQGDYEPEMVSILDRYLHPGAVFVDAGANEGYFSVVASKRCEPAGRVYAIEPQTRCRAVIEHNARANQCDNIIMLPFCVSGHAGEVTLHLHPVTNTGATSIYRTAHSALRTVSVPCFTFEAILDRQGIDVVDLLKVDIEGAEFEALMGSPRVFSQGRVRVVALEYHPKILAKRGLTQDALHQFLVDSGYTLDRSFAKTVYVRS